jgi:hypothetical protein
MGVPTGVVSEAVFGVAMRSSVALDSPGAVLESRSS